MLIGLMRSWLRGREMKSAVFYGAAAIIAFVQLPAGKASSKQSFQTEEWSTISSKDEITDEVDVTAQILTHTVEAGGSKIPASIVHISCNNNSPIVLFSAGPSGIITPGSDIEYRFGKEPGVKAPPDSKGPRDITFVLDKDRSKTFIDQAVEHESFIIRVHSTRGSVLARFSAKGARSSIDKALDGCGWYKATP